MRTVREALDLDAVTGLFDQPAGAVEHCRRFSTLLLARLPVSLCAVVLGPRLAPRVAYVANRDGAVDALQTPVVDSPALDALYDGRVVGVRVSDPWPAGLPFGPSDALIPTRGAALFVPFYTGADVGGFLTLQGAAFDFGASETHDLRSFARIFGLAIANAQLASDVERLSERSSIDALTGTLNRRAFDERLRTEWRRAVRDGASLAVALLDVDQLRMYNDTYGRPRGDECLRLVARAIGETGLRPGDSIARYGGGEFAIIMPGADQLGALALCDRVRLRIAERALAHERSQHGVITVSIGVAATLPDAQGATASLLYEADTALYRAKRAGRNRVAGDETMYTNPVGLARTLLPSVPGGFVGRTAEFDELSVASDRLLTIVGPAGIGKTALALELAHRTTERAIFVDLSHVERSAAISARVAAALAIEHGAPDRLIAALRDRTRHERLLLVLDRCEHVLAGVAEFAVWLSDVDGVRIVATSREPLHVERERVLRLGPLAHDDAVALFERAAMRANPGLSIDRAGHDYIDGLVERLDAIPMAIVFTALALRDHALEELDANLNRASASGATNAVDAAVASSYLLLSSDEKRVFARMSVFPGDCSLEAARAVSGDRGGDILRRLADKSMLVRSEGADGARLSMLAATRDFAAARLRGFDESADAHARHARHYIGLLPDHSLSAPPSRMALVEKERHNYNAALAEAATAEQWETAGELIARLSVPYLRLLTGENMPQLIATGRRIASSEAPLDLRLRVLATVAYGSYLSGDVDTLQLLVDDLLGRCGDVHDPYTLYSVTVMKYIAKIATGDQGALLDDAETVIAIAEGTGSPRLSANTFYNLAISEAEAGSDFARAADWVRRGLDCARRGAEETEHELTLAQALLCWRMGAEEEAAECFARVLRAVAGGVQTHLAEYAAIKSAGFELWRGNVNGALTLLLDVLRLIRRTPGKRATVGSLDAYVHAACRREKFDVATRLSAFVDAYRLRHGLRRSPFSNELRSEVLMRYGLAPQAGSPDIADCDAAFALALTI
jgi:diguanylate cyclase (GGDEF)-like protein